MLELPRSSWARELKPQARGRGRFAAALAPMAAVLVLAGILRADRAARSGAELLGALSPAVERLIEASGAAYAAAAAAVSAARLPLAVVLTLALGIALVRGRSPSPFARLVGALGLGWLAQSYLADARLAVGVALYVVAAIGYLARREAPEPLGNGLAPAFELASYASILAGFVLLCLYRLGVFPPLYIDEGAYLLAARMQTGELEPGPIVVAQGVAPSYPFALFQSQVAPFLVFSGGVGALSPSILTLRLVSLGAGVATLVVAVLALRPRLGARTALWMTALSAISPVFLAYSRAGFYLALTPLHAALCLAALLRFCERRDRSSALILGLLLGASVYFYQGSWIVPLVAALSLASAHGLRGLLSAPRQALLVGAMAVVVAAPAPIVFGAGLRQVLDQTLDRRAAWFGVGEGTLDLIPPSGSWDLRLLALGDRVSGLRAASRIDGRLAFRATVDVERMDELASEFEAEGWEVQRGPAGALLPLVNLSEMASMLFFAPSYEQTGHLVREPLLGHVLAPLFVLGILEALRRRRELVLRVVLVWVLAASLLPGTLASALARRAVLVPPFLYAISALPLVEARRFARRRGRGIRTATAAAAAVLLVATAASGLHAYFVRWYSPIDGAPRQKGPSYLEYSRLVRSLPAGDAVVSTPATTRLGRMRNGVEGPAGRIRLPNRATTPQAVLRTSCRLPRPVTWVGLDSTPERALLEEVERRADVEVLHRGAFRALRVLRLEPGACPDR